MLRNPNNHRLTSEGNDACSETVREIRKLYEKLRKHFNTEEAYYMISTAAHVCVMEEALSPNKE